jgi:hypothetical protein
MANTDPIHRNRLSVPLLEIDMTTAHDLRDGWTALTTDPAWPDVIFVPWRDMTEPDLIFVGWSFWSYLLVQGK